MLNTEYNTTVKDHIATEMVVTVKGNLIPCHPTAPTKELKQNDAIEIADNAPQHIKVGRVYRHFKGKLYLVLDLATHSGTGEQYVVYKALYGDCKTYIT